MKNKFGFSQREKPWSTTPIFKENWRTNIKVVIRMVKLIIAVMYKKRSIYNNAKKDLIGKFGPIVKESKPYNFDKFTKYYQKEMGKSLIKRFIIFKKQIKKEDLANIKLFTSEIEDRYRKDNKRQINLDPGYLTKTELVLASFKKGTNYKEQISDKVYAHKVLGFKKGKIITFWHTFPDYREKKNQEFLLE